MKYMVYKGCNDGTRLDIDRGIIRMYYLFRNPTHKELVDFRNGDLQVTFADFNGLGMLFTKMGELNWTDAPCNPQLFDTVPTYPINYIDMIMINTVDGRAKSVRRFAVTDDLAHDFAILTQHLIMQNTPKQILANVMQMILLYYPTDTLVAQCDKIYQAKATNIAVDVSTLIEKETDYVWRKSFRGIKPGMIRKGKYNNLPEELEPYCYWLADCGNVIMAVPEMLLDRAKSGDLYDYECPVSCTTVMRRGYRMYKGHVIVDVPYDNRLGVLNDCYDW